MGKQKTQEGNPVQGDEQEIDLRETGRLKKRLFVRYGTTNLDHTGLSYDLSPIGIFIQSSCVFPLRSRLNIELNLPDDRLLYCSGKVIWVKRISPDTQHLNEKQGMGIRLTEIPEGYTAFVNRLAENDGLG